MNDRSAGIEDALHDCRIDPGNIAFQCRPALIIGPAASMMLSLSTTVLACSLPVGAPLIVVLTYARIVLVVLAQRTIAGNARIFDDRQIVRQGINDVVGRDARAPQIDKRLGVRSGERQADVIGACTKLISCWGL